MVFYFYSILLDRHPVFLLRLGCVGVGLQGVTDTCCQSHTNKGMNLRVAPLVAAVLAAAAAAAVTGYGGCDSESRRRSFLMGNTALSSDSTSWTRTQSVLGPGTVSCSPPQAP